MWNDPLTGLKGVGPRRAEALHARGLVGLLDLLFLVLRRVPDSVPDKGLAFADRFFDPLTARLAQPIAQLTRH